MIVLSLWEIMQLFSLLRLSYLVRNLQKYQCMCDQETKERNDSHVRPNAELDKAMHEFVREEMKDAEKICRDAGWHDAEDAIKTMLSNLQFGDKRLINVSSLSADIRHALDCIIRSSASRKFVQVSPKYSDYVNNEKLLGDRVGKAFSNAIPELQEAGNCLSVECGTAAVFHLMRAVELGMRALADHLGIKRLARRRKSGKTKKYVPLPWAEWEQIIEAMHIRVDERIAKLPPGKKKQEIQEFYYPLLRDIRGFKEAFRNHVSHTRRTYPPVKAQEVFDHVRRFMTLLSTKVSMPYQRSEDDET